MSGLQINLTADKGLLPASQPSVSRPHESGAESLQYEAFRKAAQTYGSKEAEEAFLAALRRILPARRR